MLGLAVVMLRGVWERLGELALLRAVGYRTRSLQFLVLAENALLLVGRASASGVLAALASVAPHVAERRRGAVGCGSRGMLGLVLVVGLVCGIRRDSGYPAGAGDSRTAAQRVDPAMIKLGILDFDTSHGVEFTKRLNHIGDDKDQCVEGAKIVIGCPGESKLSPERDPRLHRRR